MEIRVEDNDGAARITKSERVAINAISGRYAVAMNPYAVHMTALAALKQVQESLSGRMLFKHDESFLPVNEVIISVLEEKGITARNVKDAVIFHSVEAAREGRQESLIKENFGRGSHNSLKAMKKTLETAGLPLARQFTEVGLTEGKYKALLERHQSLAKTRALPQFLDFGF